MRHDLEELKENERQLDALIETMKEASKRQQEARHSYVTCQDLHNIDMYKDQMVMVVKGESKSFFSTILISSLLPHSTPRIATHSHGWRSASDCAQIGEGGN